MTESAAPKLDKQTALAQRIDEQSSLVATMAAEAGLSPTVFRETVKALCGCTGATNEHLAALMMVAHGVGLDPIMSQMYLVPTQGGKIKPVIGVDGYLVFLHRAIKDGTIEWHDFEDTWLPDPRHPPGKPDGPKRRGGQVTLKFKNREKPMVHVEWLDEVVRDTGPWKQHQARMLRHKSYSQAVRYHLGLYIPDAEEAGATSDEPRRVDAEIRDSQPAISPAVPIAGRRAALPPPAADPFTIDATPIRTPELVEAQGNVVLPVAAGGGPEPARSESTASTGIPDASSGRAPASPAPSTDPDEEFAAEARRLEAEDAARQKKEREDLFS